MININNFVEYLTHERQRAENTVKSYRRDLLKFFTFLEKENLDPSEISEITQTNIMAYIMELEKEGRTTSTISRNIASIKTFFRYLINTGVVSNDPAYKLKPPKVKKNIPQCVDIDAVELLLSQPDTTVDKGIRDKALLELIYATGLKASEIIALRVEDINLEMRYIQCVSDDKKRIIPISIKAADAIEEYISDVRNNMISNRDIDCLFVNVKGTPFSRQGIWKIIKTYGNKAGLKNITPNVLRHSFADHLVKNGADMESLKEILGHSDTSTTQIYFQTKKDRLKEVYERSHPRK